MRAARRPNPNALSLALKTFLMPIGPSEHQRASEPGRAVRGMLGQVMHLAHGKRVIPPTFRAYGPIGGIDPRRAIKGGNGKTAIIGKRRHPRRARRRMRF